tara:strand:+ start:700 stop:915 length:216 start_codon:yes stop_codon:yes gene_type:complete
MPGFNNSVGLVIYRLVMGVKMSYDVYLDDRIVFSVLTRQQAEEKRDQMQKMIMAGVKTDYTTEQVSIKYHT